MRCRCRYGLPSLAPETEEIRDNLGIKLNRKQSKLRSSTAPHTIFLYRLEWASEIMPYAATRSSSNLGTGIQGYVPVILQ